MLPDLPDRRFAHLSADALQLLRVGAVIGTTFDFDTLCAVLGLSPEKALDPLEETIAAGVLQEIAESRFRFTSPAIREQLYKGMITPRRMLWHRKIAEVSPNPDEAVWHLGQAGDPASVPLLRAAGDRAMLAGARDQAARYYDRAVELSSPDAELLILSGAAVADVSLETAVARSLEARRSARAAGDAVVAALAQWQLACLTADPQAPRLMDAAHQELAALWREPRFLQLWEIVTGAPLHAQGTPDGLALVLLRSGRPAEAAAIIRSSHVEAGTAAQGLYDQWILAEVALLEGDLDAAFSHFRLSIRHALERKRPELADQRAGALLAEVRCHRRESLPEYADLAAAEPVDRLPRGNTPQYGEYRREMRAMTAAARACRLQGDLAGARAWLEQVDAWNEGPRPARLAGALNALELAEYHRTSGDENAARGSATYALRIGEETGSTTGLIQPAQRLLADLGKRPDGLTKRELEVALLVAQGLTDREVGERLFISPRTVDGHLRNIFNKLDLPSRTGLVAWATRQGLLG